MLVLGAGLAGATAAAALAARGIPVTVLECNAVASGASANGQGVLYTRLPSQHSDLTDFALQSYLHATALYRSLMASGVLESPADGDLCGAFMQAKETADLDQLEKVLAQVPELATVLTPEAATAYLGVAPSTAGLWLPGSGWLNPPRLCQKLLQHPLIEVCEQTGAITLHRNDGRWCAMQGEKTIATAPCAVVTTGIETLRQPELDWLPLQPVRGQTTVVPANESSSTLRAVLCHHGYIAPADAGAHCIGATFGPGDTSTRVVDEEHRANLGHLAGAVPTWQPWLEKLNVNTLTGTARLRCASNDYLPVVGQVPCRTSFLERYAGLRKKGRQVIDERGDYLPGLYVSTGHGSRGLTSTPLSAELLASRICLEVGPLSRKLCRALSPGRFIIRDLIRNRC